MGAMKPIYDLTTVQIDTFVLAGYTALVLAFLGIAWGVRRLFRLANNS